MAAESALGIVIRLTEFSETSLIVTLWTREFGKLTAIAKGARRPKGPFEGSLDLLSVCRVLVIRKSHDALDLLTEAKLHRRFRGGERSLPRTYAGYYVAEMLRLLTDDHDPHEDLYDLTIQTLGQIDGGGCVATALLRFDLQSLKMLGHAPGLDRCTHCGGPIESMPRLAFALDTSGLVCVGCRGMQRQVISISNAAVQRLIRMMQANDLPQTDHPPMNQSVYGELRGLISRYLQAVLGSTPRMQTYLPTTIGMDADA